MQFPAGRSNNAMPPYEQPPSSAGVLFHGHTSNHMSTLHDIPSERLGNGYRRERSREAPYMRESAAGLPARSSWVPPTTEYRRESPDRGFTTFGARTAGSTASPSRQHTAYFPSVIDSNIEPGFRVDSPHMSPKTHHSHGSLYLPVSGLYPQGYGEPTPDSMVIGEPVPDSMVLRAPEPDSMVIRATGLESPDRSLSCRRRRRSSSTSPSQYPGSVPQSLSAYPGFGTENFGQMHGSAAVSTAQMSMPIPQGSIAYGSAQMPGSAHQKSLQMPSSVIASIQRPFAEDAEAWQDAQTNRQPRTVQEQLPLPRQDVPVASMASSMFGSMASLGAKFQPSYLSQSPLLF